MSFSETSIATDPVQQFSVFVYNQVGRLNDLIALLQSHNVHVMAITVLDTTDSAIVRMVPRTRFAALDTALLEQLVQVAFSQRRKLLRHTLGRWLQEQGFGGHFDTQRRAEEVPVDEYVALALALAPRVRVVGVAPGLTLTSHMLSDNKFAQLHALSPLGRSSTPEDVAATVKFALENQSITGTTLLVDGGQHLMKFERDFSLM
jgi:hypothetical protein